MPTGEMYPVPTIAYGQDGSRATAVLPEALRVRTPNEGRMLRIQPMLRGFVVEVGCKCLVFENADTMAKEIARYYKNPAKVESEYLSPQKPK